MKQILPAIFTSVWKRKETKIYLLFVLFPVIFLLASFFGKSNFMQISVIGDNRVSGIAFLDMMISSADSFILPTLAIYFLTISVFRREIDDHTMFLYRDLSRKNIFFSKYLSLLSILVLFYILFTCVSTTVYFTRVVQFPFASNTFFDNDLSITLSTLEDIFGIFLKDIFSVTVASVLLPLFKNRLNNSGSYYFNNCKHDDFHDWWSLLQCFSRMDITDCLMTTFCPLHKHSWEHWALPSSMPLFS